MIGIKQILLLNILGILGAVTILLTKAAYKTILIKVKTRRNK